jgi:multidrug efflux pump subunit AcrB
MFNLASKARPFFGAVVLTAGLLTAGGIYSVTRMPSGIYPEVTFSRIAVVAKKPGLDLVSTEMQVTRPLELAASSVLGVRRVRSTTIRGGCDLSIDFAPGTDMVQALHLTWNRIGAARGQIPPDVELTVEQMTPSVFPIMSVVLTGGNSPSQLRDFAFYELAPQIKTIPDVLYANVAGGDLREIEVVARPNSLLAADLSAADLADQIRRAHRLQPVGRIEGSPLAFQILVNTQGETARQIEDLVISTKNGQPLRVRDVADVKVLHQDRVHSVGFEGKDAVVVTVFRQPRGNTVNISHDVRALLARQPPPGNIRATVVYDQANFVNTAVDNVRDAILIGSLFSVLILLAFLRSWRATLISALAIPTTLAITFLFLYWVGATLNLMSLGGLAVAIGLIIDDTVVVVENIARHLSPSYARGQPAGRTVETPARRAAWYKPWTWGRQRETSAHGLPQDSSSAPEADGVPAHSAALPPVERDPVDAASSEITGAVVGSTLTTVIVFLPLALIAGVYGQFFASLSWALSIAVLVSMVISLTLIPVFAAKFLAGRPMPEPGRIYIFFVDRYEKIFETSLRFPWATLMLSFAAIGFGVLLFTGIPDWSAKQEPGEAPPEPLVKGLETGLMPAMDEGSFTLDYFAPMGTPLSRTEEMGRKLEEILRENPDVDVYVRRTGTQMGLFATKTNRGDIQVSLRPAEDDIWSLLTKPVRPELSEIEEELKRDGKEAIRRKYRRRPMIKVMEEIEDKISEYFTQNQLQTELIQIMQDQLNDLSGQNKPLEVKLFGPDYGTLRPMAEAVAETFEKQGKGRGIRDVNSHVFAGNPDLMVRVKGYWAARGLTAMDVERQLRAMYLGQIATQVRESSLRITDVRVRYPDDLRFGRGRFDPDLVLEQPILLPGGVVGTSPASPGAPLPGPARTVPLGAVARLERLRTPDEQVRENQQPVVIVTAEQNEEEAGLGSVVTDIRAWMGDVKMPPGYHWELGGHYLQQQAAFRSLTIVMVVAVLLVYIMLAFQFRSVVLPLLIFLEQPLSLVSGLFALWITNTPLNISSYMGAILLIGLDMKNGILLVEYIQQLLRKGMELRPALLLAGRVRFRPILMTSLAAILGLLPLALGIGPGAQMQQPLAIMVMGGLIANMLFTRMVIRAGYLLLERRRVKRGAEAPVVEGATPLPATSS